MIARSKLYVLLAVLTATLVAAAPSLAAHPFVSVFDECDPVLILGDFFNVGPTKLCAQVKDNTCIPIPGENVWFAGENLWGQPQSAGDPDPLHPNAILTGLFGVGCRSVNWPPDVYKVVAETAAAVSDPVVVTVVSRWDSGVFAGGLIKAFCWGSFPNVRCGLEPRRVTFGFEYVFPLWLCSLLDNEANIEESSRPRPQRKFCFDLPKGKHERLLLEDPDNPLGPIEFSAKDFDLLCIELGRKREYPSGSDDTVLWRKPIVKAVCLRGRGIFSVGGVERNLKFELCFKRGWHRWGWKDPIVCLKVFEPDPKVLYEVCGHIEEGGFRVKLCPHDG